MASKRELLKAAMEEVRSGKPRQQVFETYRPQVGNDKHLSFAIASIADPQRIPQAATLNNVLFGMLVFAAVTKGLMALGYFGQSFIGGLFMLVLGLFVPVVFAIGVRKRDGQIYPFLVLLAGVGALNALLKMTEEGAWMLVDVALLAVIGWLAYRVQQLMFPNIRLFKVRKDDAGNYLW